MSEMDYLSALAKHAEIRVMRSMHTSKMEQLNEQPENLKVSDKHYYEWFISNSSSVSILLCKTCWKLAHDCERWRENDTEQMEFVK